MIDLLTAILVIIGSVFCLLAAVGVLRLPDMFTRMQAAAKGGSAGASLLILAVAVHFGEFGVAARAFLVVGFLFLTAPIAAHMIGRAAYCVGVPVWKGTGVDDLRGHYDPTTHELESVSVSDGAGAVAPPAETGGRHPD